MVVVVVSILVLTSYAGSVDPENTPGPSSAAPEDATTGKSGDGAAPPAGEGDASKPSVGPAAPGDSARNPEDQEGAGNPVPVANAEAPGVPTEGSGQLTVAKFERKAPIDQLGRKVRVRVEVENDLDFQPDGVAKEAADILQDPRSWNSKQPVHFDFVGEGGYDVAIRVLTPATTDTKCLPLRTGGEVSCRNGSGVNLNAKRWAIGVPDYTGDLPGYRTYLVNHEMGHFIGHDHVNCPGEGEPAPVMMQQTKGLKGCARNPWP